MSLSDHVRNLLLLNVSSKTPRISQKCKKVRRLMDWLSWPPFRLLAFYLYLGFLQGLFCLSVTFFHFFKTLSPNLYLRGSTIKQQPLWNLKGTLRPILVAHSEDTRERGTKRWGGGGASRRRNRRRESYTSSLLLPLQGGRQLCLPAAGSQQRWETVGAASVKLILFLILHWCEFISAQALSTRQCWRQGVVTEPSSPSQGWGSRPNLLRRLSCQLASRTKLSIVRSVMCMSTLRLSSNRLGAKNVSGWVASVLVGTEKSQQSFDQL